MGHAKGGTNTERGGEKGGQGHLVPFGVSTREGPAGRVRVEKDQGRCYAYRVTNLSTAVRLRVSLSSLRVYSNL